MSGLDEDDLGRIEESVGHLRGAVEEVVAALSDEVTEIGDELPTKRERTAIAALQGLLTAPDAPGRHHLLKPDAEGVARDAVGYADALLAELAKPVTEGGPSGS